MTAIARMLTPTASSPTTATASSYNNNSQLQLHLYNYSYSCTTNFVSPQRAMQSSAQCTLYDLIWDPNLRRIIHTLPSKTAVATLRDSLYTAGITTFKRANAELQDDSPCLAQLGAHDRAHFLKLLARKDPAGEELHLDSLMPESLRV